jgi:pimeloyl-ACP methyl ester carboxylesterase
VTTLLDLRAILAPTAFDDAGVPAPGVEVLCLVGHSYGGFVIINAATGGGDMKELVYIDAFARPLAGRQCAGLSGAARSWFGECDF